MDLNLTDEQRASCPDGARPDEVVLMASRGIVGFGGYVPRLRIDRAAIARANAWAFPSLRGVGSRALANWDEDAVTMAVSAARGLAGADTRALSLASTTAPFADLQNAALVAAALGLGNRVGVSDFAGSVRAGLTALLAALREPGPGQTIVTAADARRAKPGSAQEMANGAGAAAFVVGQGAPIAELRAATSRADLFIDHFRANGAHHDYQWEERWVRDEGYLKILPAAIADVLAQAGVGAAEVTQLCLAAPGATALAVAKAAGLSRAASADPLAAACGDTGAAHPLLMLAAALERALPGEHILVAGFGAGCDVLLLRTTDAITCYKPRQSISAALAAGVVESHYTKLLSFQGELNLDWGMRAEGGDKVSLTQQYRARDQLGAFCAGECPDCGAVQFPQLAACVACGGYATLAPRSLVDEPATLVSFTADWLQYHPSPPLCFGLVQFANGARVMMEIIDADLATIDVGAALRMVYRIKSVDLERDYRRYFWKAAPLGAGVASPAGTPPGAEALAAQLEPIGN